MKCQNCGAPVSQNAKFCSHCGSPIERNNEFTFNYNENKRSENVDRIVDEADIIRAKSESGKNKSHVIVRSVFVAAWAVVLIVLFLMIKSVPRDGLGSFNAAATGYWIIAIIVAILGIKTFSKWLK